MVASIHWFRHGLRLHDNPALLEALDGATEFYPIFIIDGEVAGKLLLWSLIHTQSQLTPVSERGTRNDIIWNDTW